MQGDNIPSPTRDAYGESEDWNDLYPAAKTEVHEQRQNQGHRLATVPVPTYVACGLKRNDAGRRLADALRRCSGQDLISYIGDKDANADTSMARVVVTSEAAIAVSAAVTDILHSYAQRVKQVFCDSDDQKMRHTKASLEAVLQGYLNDNPAIKRLLTPSE